MTNNKHLITGRIIASNQNPLPKLTIQVFDKDPISSDDPLGQPVQTDENGNYRIEYTPEDFQKGDREKDGLDIYIQVLAENKVIAQSEVVNNAGQEVRIDLVIEDWKQETKPYKVYGNIQDAKGKFLSEIKVQALDKDLRTEQLLGEALVKDGTYTIHYSPNQFKNAEKEQADLLIKVVNPEGKILYTSPVHFNAPSILEHDIVLQLTANISLWERLTDCLPPLLDGMKPTELHEDRRTQDISFLAAETGEDYQAVYAWAVAHQLQGKNRISLPGLFGLLYMQSPELQYDHLLGLKNEEEVQSLARQDILTAMTFLSEAEQKSLLLRAIEEAIIPESFAEKVDTTLKKLQKLKATALTDPVLEEEILGHSLDKFEELSPKQQAYVQQTLDRQLEDRILDVLQNRMPKLRRALHRLPLHALEYRDWTLSQLIREKVLPALHADTSLEDLREQLPDQNALQGGTRTLSELLRLEDRLRDHPLFRGAYQIFKTNALGKIARFSQGRLEALLSRGSNWEDRSYAEWKSLLGKGPISEKQLKHLYFIYDLAKITGDHFSLVQALKKDRRIGETQDLIRLKKEDWEKLLANTEQATPTGEEKEVYLQKLMRTVERSFPTPFFMQGFIERGKSDRRNDLKALQPLFKKNEQLLSQDKVDWEGIDEKEREELTEVLTRTRHFANTYQYLGAAEILEGKGSVAQKNKAIQELMDSLTTFYENNPDLDLRRTNFLRRPGSDGSTLNWDGISEALQPQLQKQMLVLQRVNQLAPDAASSLRLLERKNDSAYRIAGQNKYEFITRSGLTQGDAEQAYQKAQHVTTVSSLQFASLVELQQNLQLGLTVDNTIPLQTGGYSLIAGECEKGQLNGGSLYEEVRNELEELPGYANFFGPQNFCQCDHCRSVLGPAAYFVDLMHFIEVHITRYSQLEYLDADEIEPEPGPASSHSCNGNPDYPLWLRNRRPDLWNKVNISCDNTYQLVPYLQIVNEVKQAYIEEVTGWADVFAALADPDNQISFNAPRSLPFYEILAYLEHFQIELADIFEALNISQDFSFAFLGIQEDELLHSGSSIFKRFGDKSSFTEMEVPEFLKYLQISRRELDELLDAHYISSGSDLEIEKEAFDEGIQYWNEKLVNITAADLEQIHFFVKLWKTLPWSIGELDLVFSALGHLLSAPITNQDRVDAVVKLRQIQDRLKVEVEELVAIVDILPDRSIKTIERKDPLTQELIEEKVPGFFTRQFDLWKIFKGSPTVATLDEEGEAFLLSGLNISQEEKALIQAWTYRDDTDIVLNDLTNLDRHNPVKISQYYRHTRLARALQLNLEEWGSVIKLFDAPLETIEDVAAIIDLVTTFKAGPFSFEELLILVAPNAVSYSVDPDELKAVLYHEEFPTFGQEVFANLHHRFLEPKANLDTFVAELISRDILQADEEDDGLLQLTTAYSRHQLKGVFQDMETAGIINADLWNEIGIALTESLNRYHFMWPVSNEFLAQAELLAIGDLDEAEVTVLEALLTTHSFIKVNPEHRQYRVLNGYDFDQLENLIDAISGDDFPTIKQHLDDHKSDIDAILHEPRVFSKALLLETEGFTKDDVDDLLSLLDTTGLIENSTFSGYYARSSTYTLADLKNAIDGLPETNATEIAFKTLLTDNTSRIDQIIKRNAFLSEDRLGSISGLAPADITFLLQRLRTENLIEALAAPIYYRVLDSYDPTVLRDAILNLPQTSPEASTIRDHLLASFESIDTLIGSKKPTSQYHAVWAQLTGLESKQVDALAPIINAPDWQTGFYKKYQDYLIDGLPPGYQSYFQKVQRAGLLFGHFSFSAEAIQFIAGHWEDELGLSAIELDPLLTLENLKRLLAYQSWITLDPSALADYLHPMLTSLPGGSTELEDAFEHYFGFPKAETEAYYNATFDADPASLDMANIIRDQMKLGKALGLNGSQFQLFADLTYSNAKTLSGLLLAKFRSGYEHKEDFDAAFDPYASKINEIKRDILCEYILAREEDLNFKDPNDLYEYFLLDIQMSGCMKTSRIVAAISSLQLYVERVIRHREKGVRRITSGGTTQDVTVFQAYLDDEGAAEWAWRKNYRVWEANRKVFLYPENFIEPELRDNKSPEFKELEDELLQQKITLESAENAYKEYLKKCTETLNLKIAGATVEKVGGDGAKGHEVYHIFGHTFEDPPQYYYRRIIIHPGDGISLRKKEWTPWEKVDLSIPCPYVSPIIFQGRIYIFWTQVTIQRLEKFENGTSKLKGHSYDIKLYYSVRNFQGRWLQAQELKGFFTTEDFDEHDYQAFAYKNSRVRNRVFPLVKIINSGLSNEYPQLRIDYLRDHSSTFGYLHSYIVDFAKNRVIHDSPTDYYVERSNKMMLSSAGSNSVLARSALGYSQDDSIAYFERNNLGVLFSYDPLTKPYDNKNQKSDLRFVLGKEEDAIFSYDKQEYLIRSTSSDELSRAVEETGGTKVIVFEDSERQTIALNESYIIEQLNDIIYNQGFLRFLDISTQALTAPEVNITYIQPQKLLGPFNHPSKLNFDGANGLYYQELFFHIPFSIAKHLNAEGKYKDADWWYRRIFDPTASEDDFVDPDRPQDRNWRYIEFRNQGLPKYSEMLSDPAAIEVYKKDPFNPHAIARVRTSAYPKAVFSGYIDNLLDWADSLFRQFTMESINEAMSLYIMVQDLLGDRPQELCKCETAMGEDLHYADLETALSEGSEFLIHHQNYQISLTPSAPSSGGSSDPSLYQPIPVMGYDDETDTEPVSSYGSSHSHPTVSSGLTLVTGATTTNQLVFCVPRNDKMDAYWDRVEDRLFKIRHCQDITGVTRTPALFESPIDPALLVLARASGLSVADAIAGLNAPVPYYRFNYMLDRAKSFVGTVQSLGGALLSAMEKKDAEELMLLRSTHEQNILKMTKEIKQQQIEESRAQINNLEATKKNVEIREAYYTELINNGLITWEKAQQRAQHTVSVTKITESVMGYLAGMLSLSPNVGAPTAMTYGGIQLSDSISHIAVALQATADVAGAIAVSAGLEAGNQRREEEWEQQQKLAEQELKAIDQQIAAANIRLAIAEKDLEVHNKQIEQAKELEDFYKTKFSNLKLYNFQATTLNRLYSQAYNLAFDLAKQAEQCYRFETDDISFFIEGDNWDAGFAGLLAGEQLLLQLQRMEKAYIENTPRREEITQSFSVRQIDPAQIINLQENGECAFSIPEWCFDLFYPGHYRRRIKSVRLTIPCVAGPYTNVSCRLSLGSHQIRTEPIPGADNLFAGPGSASGVISTSSANNDGGQFELNFQGARYLPFEGAGAVNSEFQISLPKVMRSFDYQSISDVIIHISYTALYDSTLRTTVEEEFQSMVSALQNQDLYRLVSLKQEFPDLLHQLISGSAGILKLENRHFPYFASFRGVDVQNAKIIKAGSVETITPDNPTGTSWEFELENAYIHTENNDVIMAVTYQIQ